MVLRAAARQGLGDRQRVMIWNMFVDMLQLLDTLVATHTPRCGALAGNDCLIFMRDALVKMSLELNRIALDVSRGRKVQYRSTPRPSCAPSSTRSSSSKQGFGEREPEMLALIIQVLRRLRNSTASSTGWPTTPPPRPTPSPPMCCASAVAHALHLAPGIPLRPLDQQPAPGFAALPLRAARDGGGGAGDDAGQPLAVAGIFSAQLLDHADHRDHHETGFALTRQRNGWRLTGTVIGCVCALLLFNLTDSPEILFAVLLAACIMGNSLVQLNYMASAIFNTLFVVLVFHFVSRHGVHVGDRRTRHRHADRLRAGAGVQLHPALVGGPLLKPLAAATRANREYLLAGMRYADAMQAPADPAPDAARGRQAPAIADADLAGGWRARTCTLPSATSPRRSTA